MRAAQSLSLLLSLWCALLGGVARAHADEARDLTTYRKSAELFEAAAAAERRGMRSEARAAYAKAVERDPAFVEALVNLARLEIADGNLAAAQESIERAEQIRSDYPMIAATRGVLALASGDVPNAVEALSQAHRAEPDNAEICVNLGAALIRRSRFDEARRVLGALLRSQPDQSEALYNLALANDLSGRSDAAILAYRRFVALAPADDPDRESVLRRLEALAASAGARGKSVHEPSLGSETGSINKGGTEPWRVSGMLESGDGREASR